MNSSLNLEGVVAGYAVRHIFPASDEIDGLRGASLRSQPTVAWYDLDNLLILKY
jgi:hypothetical protein